MKTKKQTTQTVQLHIPITYLGSTWKGKLDKLPANKTYTLVIDYPFAGMREHLFPIKTGKNGLNVLVLLAKIGKAYEKLYEDPEGNGVFGHSIDDLSLGEICVNHKTKQITIGVDS
jgi:hypothetical protein